MVCFLYLDDGGAKLRDWVDVETWRWGVMRSAGGLGKAWAQGGGAGKWLMLPHRLCSRERLQGADASFTYKYMKT